MKKILLILFLIIQSVGCIYTINAENNNISSSVNTLSTEEMQKINDISSKLINLEVNVLNDSYKKMNDLLEKNQLSEKYRYIFLYLKEKVRITIKIKTGKTPEELDKIIEKIEQFDLEKLEKLSKNFDEIIEKYGETEKTVEILNFIKKNTDNIIESKKSEGCIYNGDTYKAGENIEKSIIAEKYYKKWLKCDNDLNIIFYYNYFKGNKDDSLDDPINWSNNNVYKGNNVISIYNEYNTLETISNINNLVSSNTSFELCNKGTNENKLKCLISNIGINNELVINEFKIRKNTCKDENNCLLFLEGKEKGDNFLVAPVEFDKSIYYTNVSGKCSSLEVPSLGFENKGKWKMIKGNERINLLSKKNRDFKFINYWVSEKPDISFSGMPSPRPLDGKIFTFKIKAWDIEKNISSYVYLPSYTYPKDLNIPYDPDELRGLASYVCYLPLNISTDINNKEIYLNNEIKFSNNITIKENESRLKCGGNLRLNNKNIFYGKGTYNIFNGKEEKWTYKDNISESDVCKWSCKKGYKKSGNSCLTDYRECKGTPPKSDEGVIKYSDVYQYFGVEKSYSYITKDSDDNSCKWTCKWSYEVNGNTCKPTFNKEKGTTNKCNDNLFLGRSISSYPVEGEEYGGLSIMGQNNTGYICRTTDGYLETLMKDGKCLAGKMSDKNLVNIGERSPKDKNLECTKNGFIRLSNIIGKEKCNSNEIQVYRAYSYATYLNDKICIPKNSKVCKSDNGQIYAAISNYKYSESTTINFCKNGTSKGYLKGNIIGGEKVGILHTDVNCNNNVITSKKDPNSFYGSITIKLNSNMICRYAGDDKNYTLLNNSRTECYEAKTKSSSDNNIVITKTIKVGEAYSSSLICTQNGFANFNSNPTKCKEGYIKISEYNSGTMCAPKGSPVCKKANGEYYAVKVNYLYSKSATVSNCKKYEKDGVTLIKDSSSLNLNELNNTGISSICNDSNFQGIKLDNSLSCRFPENNSDGTPKSTLMNANNTKCYRVRYIYKIGEGPNLEGLKNALKTAKVYSLYQQDDYGNTCTNFGLLSTSKLNCPSDYVKVNDICVQKNKFICRNKEGFFNIETSRILNEGTNSKGLPFRMFYGKMYNEEKTKNECEKNGGKIVLGSKKKVDNNITSTCNNNKMPGISVELGSKFRCSNSDLGDTQTLMNAEKTICYKLTGTDLSKAVPYNIGDSLDMGSNGKYICTQNGFVLRKENIDSCEKGMKKVEYTSYGSILPSFSSSNYACVPNNFITCKVNGKEYIGDSKKGTKDYCEYAGGDFITPNETENCNDDNINGNELDENLICRIPLEGGKATIMNKDGTKCKYGNNWYRVGQTFDKGIGDGKKYYKCTMYGVSENDEDIFLDESVDPEDKTEFYTNYLCKSSVILGNPLTSDYQCRAPLGTTSYTLMTDPGLSCFNVSADALKGLGEKNTLSEQEKKESLEKIEKLNDRISLYDNGLKDFDNQVTDKPEKERAAIKTYWSLVLENSKKEKEKEIEKSGAMTRNILQRENAIGIKPLGENDIGGGSFGICTTAGLFGEGGAGGGGGSISVKKGDTKPTDNFLQYVNDDACGGKFVLNRDVSGIIINKMEIKASCENKDSKQDGNILKECKEWGGNGIYDRFITLEKQKKPSCEKSRTEVGPDASDEEIEAANSANEAAEEAEKECKDEQKKQIKEWEEKIEECLSSGEGGEGENGEGENGEGEEGYSPEPKRKKQCYIDNPYPFGQEIYNYKAVCETKYGSFNENLVKITEIK